MSRRQWLAFAGLCLASLALSQLLPITLPWANPLLRQHSATAVIALFAAVPALLAGATLNVPAAILVGLCAGLGRAIGQTGAPVDIVAGGLAAGASAWLMQQNYAGRLFRALRRPAVAGPLGRLMWVAFILLGAVADVAPRAGLLAALDLGLFLGLASAAPLLLEGAVSGLLAGFILWMAPQWRPERGLVPSPFKRTLQRQLTTAFVAFAAVLLLLSVLVALGLSARAGRRAAAAQIAANADATAVRLGAWQTDLVATLAAYQSDAALADADPQVRTAALGRLQRAAPQLSRIAVIGETLVASSDGGQTTLSAAESELVAAALAAGEARFGVEPTADGPQVSLALPRAGGDEALLGRVAPAALAEVAASLQPDGGAGGLLVDEQSRVVAGTGAADAAPLWKAPTTDQQLMTLPGGQAVYETLDANGARQLVAYALVPQSGWRAVAVVPQARVLGDALGVVGPLALLLLAASGLFLAYVANLGQAIARPIGEMSQASRAIAGGGGLERPVRNRREDEIGQLSLAFSQMQRALRQRLDELSLLLGVSNGVAATVDLSEGSDSFTALDQISPYMIAAVMTTEDGGFWKHKGFITSQFQAALKRNLEAGKIRLGASTITMQMVKNVLLSHERTLSRKLQELFLTWYVEQSLSKQRIMEIYLNVIEFGPGIYGVTRGASHYFGKTPAELERAVSLGLHAINAESSGEVERIASIARTLGTRARVAFSRRRSRNSQPPAPGNW